MSCEPHVDAVGWYLTRITPRGEPYCYPAAPGKVPFTFPEGEPADLNLWFECLRRAFAAHCRIYKEDTWRQIILCAVKLFDAESMREIEEAEE